jgi:hypothetical protein
LEKCAGTMFRVDVSRGRNCLVYAGKQTAEHSTFTGTGNKNERGI